MATRLDKDVQQLLARHGYDVEIVRVNDGGSYDTSTGTFSGGTTTSETFRGVFVNYKEEDIDGTAVEADDRKLLLQARNATMVPDVGDVVDDEVSLVNVRRIKSGETTIAYICQTRG